MSEGHLLLRTKSQEPRANLKSPPGRRRQNVKSKKVAIVGAGVMGLTLAYLLTKNQYDVTVFEKDGQVGGMSASFDFDGLATERYYHFFCKPDFPVFNLLEELGLSQRLTWRETKMGFFYQGKLYPWGNPVALLLFPRLGLLAKLRFGLQVFLSVKRDRWDRLDRLTAVDWARKFVGEKGYRVLWDSLLRLKFHSYRDQVSAAWVWRRLRRVGRSRKSMLTESLAYLAGGIAPLLSALQERITSGGGTIRLQAGVSRLLVDENNQRISGITVDRRDIPFDIVVTTIPLPYIPAMAPGLPGEVLERYRRLDNIGVVCPILKLTRPLTGNFWLNISDDSINLPGLIEYTNLNPLPDKLVYFPFYLHRNQADFSKPDGYFLDRVRDYCRRINPGFNASWVLGERVHRYEYAQPVCPPGYLEMLPPVKTVLQGLYIMDTSYYYPEDRSISESVNAAQRLLGMIEGQGGMTGSD
jgi:protoporphyrinogen oxidase